MRLPNFIIVGAPKAGTTALHYYLDQHPQVFMSPMKEPSFFWAYEQRVELKGPGSEVLRHRYVDTIEDYQGLFKAVTNEKAIGESSVRYFSHPPAPALIHQLIPQAKLIFILRQPADRAFSAFVHYRRDGIEPCADFAQAIAEERQGVRQGWTFGRYLQDGLYYTNIQRYLQIFDRQQIHISLYENLTDHPDDLVSDLFRFLEIDSSYVLDTSHRHNVSGVIRNPILRMLWTQSNHIRAAIRPMIPERLRHTAAEWLYRDLVKVPFDPELRAELTGIYRNEIINLQELLQRDLSRWLE